MTTNPGEFGSWTVTRIWRDVQADGPIEAIQVTLRANPQEINAVRQDDTHCGLCHRPLPHTDAEARTCLAMQLSGGS